MCVVVTGSAMSHYLWHARLNSVRTVRTLCSTTRFWAYLSCKGCLETVSSLITVIRLQNIVSERTVPRRVISCDI